MCRLPQIRPTLLPAEDAKKVVNKDHHKLTRTLLRCLRLRCPACGASSIFRGPFRVRHHCPACRALFLREEGFFVGALMVNVVAAELAGLAVSFVCLLTIGYSEGLILAAGLPLGLVFALSFYHHSWSVWLCLDYLIESLPQYHGR